MIRNLKYSLLAIALIIQGCSNTMNTAENRQKYGQAVNVVPNEINFLSWCGFAVSTNLLEAKRFRIGRVLLSETELLVIPSNTEVELRRIKFSEMEGIHFAKFGLGRQIQIRMNSEYFVLELYNDMGTISISGTKKLYEEMISEGVPEMDTGEYLINTRAGEWIFFLPIPI